MVEVTSFNFLDSQRLGVPVLIDSSDHICIVDIQSTDVVKRKETGVEKVDSAVQKLLSCPSNFSSLSSTMIGFPCSPSGGDIGGGVGDCLTGS